MRRSTGEGGRDGPRRIGAKRPDQCPVSLDVLPASGCLWLNKVSNYYFFNPFFKITFYWPRLTRRITLLGPVHSFERASSQFPSRKAIYSNTSNTSYGPLQSHRPTSPPECWSTPSPHQTLKVHMTHYKQSPSIPSRLYVEFEKPQSNFLFANLPSPTQNPVPTCMSDKTLLKAEISSIQSAISNIQQESQGKLLSSSHANNNANTLVHI